LFLICSIKTSIRHIEIQMGIRAARR